MEETAQCDKVVIIDSGKIAAVGTPHSLKEQYAGNRLMWYTAQSEAAEKSSATTGLNLIITSTATKFRLTAASKPLI